jgi:thiosulfate/3-mercaptopyruvate sulfurtransferase
MIPAMAPFPRPELVATTAWLEENLGRPEVRIVDLRWRPDGSGARLHAEGHIPGATYVDWESQLVERDEATGAVHIAGPDHVASVFGAAGVGDGCTVVLFDDMAGLYAGRAWWTLAAYGFDSVRILDGGWRAWVAEERPTSARPSLHEPAIFTPRAALRLRLTASDLGDILGAPRMTIVDSRPAAEYAGEQGRARRLGRIPGAVNLAVARTVAAPYGRLRDAASLGRIVGSLPAGDRVVVYDEAGIGAARLAWVLSVMGRSDVTVLDGGWAEWSERPDLPVA